MRRRRRDLPAARNRAAAETPSRYRASSAHRRAAGNPAPIYFACRDRLCHFLADWLLFGVDPSLLGETLHQTAPLVAGAIVCELFLIAAIAILTSGKFASQTATLIALLLLPPTVWILVGAEVAHSLALLVFAAAV